MIESVSAVLVDASVCEVSERSQEKTICIKLKHDRSLWSTFDACINTFLATVAKKII